MPTSNELREQRAKLIHQARDILNRAEQEKRDLSSEETQQFDKLHADAERLQAQIERQERQERLEAELRRSQGTIAGGRQDGPPRQPGDGDAKPDSIEARQQERARAFRSFLLSQSRVDTSYQARALQADNPEAGGYTVRGELFVERLIKAVDDIVYIRQLATVFQVTDADSLGVPTLAADPSDADWTTELATGSEDTSMKFGKRQLHPQPLAKRIKVSRKLLEKSALPIEDIIRDRLAYKFALPQEKAFLTGTGAQQPLGVFTASVDGISTSRDVSTGNTSTEIRTDGLIEAKYTLKAQYWPRAVWIFHRDALKQIAKLKDGDGQYLWQLGVQNGQPDRLLGFPFRVSEFAPNTFTTGKYVGILGDFSNYWIADSMAMEVQRLVELYAETNQIGFIGRLETDGMPVLEEAFVRVKLA